MAEPKGKKTKSPKPPKDFQLIKAIRGKKQKNIEGEASLYKANVLGMPSQVFHSIVIKSLPFGYGVRSII